jgi:3-methyladenine DNA glycosylase AlkD
LSSELTAADLIRDLDALADPSEAESKLKFFKTGAGEYGEGDKFIGLSMPTVRKTVKPYRDLPLDEIAIALSSPIHEHRTAALVIASDRANYAKRQSDLEGHEELYEFYLAHTATINNWDLVDVSCRNLVGEYLLTIGDTDPLKQLAVSKDIWERRIGIVSTYAFINAGQLEPTFEVAEILINDEHDLIHKATGWMLREAGKKDPHQLDVFLRLHAHHLPRTALRYSIERMPPSRQSAWLAYDGT